MTPPMKPGTNPATNNCSTEVLAETAYRIIGMEDGIIIASQSEDEVTAADSAVRR